MLYNATAVTYAPVARARPCFNPAVALKAHSCLGYASSTLPRQLEKGVIKWSAPMQLLLPPPLFLCRQQRHHHPPCVPLEPFFLPPWASPLRSASRASASLLSCMVCAPFRTDDPTPTVANTVINTGTERGRARQTDGSFFFRTFCFFFGEARSRDEQLKRKR